MRTLLSVKDLAERWDYSESKVRQMEAEGKLKRWGVDEASVKFSLPYIESLEQLEDMDRLSPLERKRLESENEKLKNEVEKLQSILRRISIEVLQAGNF